MRFTYFSIMRAQTSALAQTRNFCAFNIDKCQ